MRSPLSIFARTFLLLFAALLIAHATGMVLQSMRKPAENAVKLSELVALLSSHMPAAKNGLRLQVVDDAPDPGATYVSNPYLRDVLAEWLDAPREDIRFYQKTALPQMRPPPPPWFGHEEGARWERGPETMPMPQGPHADDIFSAPSGHGPSQPPFADWDPDSLLRGEFVAALRRADGHWRMVENIPATGSPARELSLLFLIGMLMLLPLAWWFSRAMSAPIKRFADVADRMGHDAVAPALPVSGPTEIAHAAAAFNAMQARISRLLRERTQMAGAIAHDLRTPLTRLAFRLEGLPAGLRDKASADIEEMSQMIQETLDFLQGQARGGAYEALDLRQLVEDLAAGMRETGADVQVAQESCSVPMQGDPLALRRMIANLIDNALKYGERARLRLLRAEDHYELQIDDDGPGIDPDQHDQLFLPFVRGESSRNRQTGGIGLGLASARDVAVSHGGEILLRNREGGGLRAMVRLPRDIRGRRQTITGEPHIAAADALPGQ